MPAYSFKAQFVEPIKAGNKRQTIRGKRKGQAKPGSPLYLYYGMRTKFCTKILDAVCASVDSVKIYDNGVVILNGETLTDEQKADLAIKDGFPNFQAMLDFWNENNELPFDGDLIRW